MIIDNLTEPQFFTLWFALSFLCFCIILADTVLIGPIPGMLYSIICGSLIGGIVLILLIKVIGWFSIVIFVIIGILNFCLKDME